MDAKFMKAMKHYYVLKEQYDTILLKQNQKIMSIDNLSKREKRDRYIRTIKKCINCKKPGGTIFTNTNGRLKAVCGSVEQCNLNIELFKSKFINSREEVRLYLNDLNKYKTSIIMTKLDFLFGYVADETTIQTSYIVGVLCFAYLAFYAWKVSAILKNQGINFDKKVSGGH